MNSVLAPVCDNARPGSQPATATEVAELLVAYLEQIGVEYVFGIPGGAIEPFYNALARSARRGGPRHILARHESGAAFMADGYARETGLLGVCCSTSGPGATNLITGVACAHDNEVPLLVITAQPPLPVFGRNAVQESSCTGINTLGMFRHCTHYNSLVSHPKQLEPKLIASLQAATRAPRGAAHLSFPVDVFRSPASNHAPAYDLRGLLHPASLLDQDAVGRLGEELRHAKKPVLFIGGGCGEAIDAILQFSVLRNAAVVTTLDGKGLVDPGHPLFRGVFGFGGHASADATLCDPAADLIIAAGTSMGELNTGGWSDTILNHRLVHIDESEEHLASTPMARLHVRGRIRAIFDSLIKQCAQGDASTHDHHPSPQQLIVSGQHTGPELAEPDQFDSEAIPITPQRLMKELGRRFPPTTRFLADTGNSFAWATHYLHPVDREVGSGYLGGSDRRQGHGGWLRATMNFGPMGWAIGGAVGTAAGNPAAPVVCITGDGSMLMNGQELSVAVAEGLTVIFVVLNDRALGMVKHGQRLAGAQQIGCELPATDFAALARALGAEGYTVRGPKDFDVLDIDAMCVRKGPTLLDVLIDPEQVPPMKMRVKVLNSAN
ncbi:MAG: thiamine pyrophosphate-binding protein [Pseudomonadota bacterium]